MSSLREGLTQEQLAAVNRFESLILNTQRNAIILYSAGIFVAQPSIVERTGKSNEIVVSFAFIITIILLIVTIVEYLALSSALEKERVEVPLRISILAIVSILLIGLTIVTWYYSF